MSTCWSRGFRTGGPGTFSGRFPSRCRASGRSWRRAGISRRTGSRSNGGRSTSTSPPHAPAGALARSAREPPATTAMDGLVPGQAGMPRVLSSRPTIGRPSTTRRGGTSRSTVSSSGSPPAASSVMGGCSIPSAASKTCAGNGSVAWGKRRTGSWKIRSGSFARSGLKNERHGFLLHPATASAIRRLGPRLLPAASPDRLSVELVRSLSADPAGTIDDLRRLGLMNVLLPESGRHASRAAERIARRYRFLRRSLGTPLPLHLLLGNLLADLPPDSALAAARRLRLPGLRSVASTLRCLHTLTHPEALRFPRAETESALLATEDARGSIALYRAVRLTGNLPARNLNRFVRKCRSRPFIIDGIWLEENGFPEGPMRREILLRIREETLAGKVARPIDAVRLAESMR